MGKLKERIKWLFTKDGRPTLLVIIVGFAVGFLVDGAVGIILSTILGLVILSFLKKWHLPTKPWQSTVSTLLPIIAQLSFMMIFFLPIGDALMLPSGHYPNTLMKYLSIMVVKPDNIVSGAPVNNIFPGIPIIVAISVVLMFWGSLNLGKTKNFLIAFTGLILYTLSPTIAAISLGNAALRIDFTFFAIGYYLGWVGLILVAINRFLPRILKTPVSIQPNPSVQRVNRFMSIMPIVGIGLFFMQFLKLHFDFSILTVQDFTPEFEAAHHEFAGLFSGIIAGVGGGLITSNVSSTNDSSGYMPPTSDIPPPPPIPDSSPPEPTPPEEPLDPDEIKQKLEQQQINEKYKSEYEKDRDKSINDDKTKAANDDQALHNAQEHLHDESKKFYKDFYAHENEFNSWEAEHELKKAEGFEKLEHAAEYTKKGADWAIWVGKYTVPGGKTLADAYEATSEFAEGASEGGLVKGLEKGGIKVGEKMLEHLTMHTLEHKLKGTDAGEFIKYVNEEGEPAHDLGTFVVDATKDKLKGLGPEQAGDWAKKKLGLENEEGHEGGSEGAKESTHSSSEE